MSGADLDRFGDTRKVGGHFESLQRVPRRRTPERGGLQGGDLAAIIQALSFEARDETLGVNSFLGSFGQNVLGIV